MIKHVTLKESQQPSPEKLQQSAYRPMIRPSGLTMKFIFGYSASLEVHKSILLGTTSVLLN